MLLSLLKKRRGRSCFELRTPTRHARYVEGAIQVIYDSLRQTGLLWDEDPDKGGPVGPYVQPERKEIYRNTRTNSSIKNKKRITASAPKKHSMKSAKVLKKKKVLPLPPTMEDAAAFLK